MNEKLELIFFEALEVRKHKVKICFFYKIAFHHILLVLHLTETMFTTLHVKFIWEKRRRPIVDSGLPHRIKYMKTLFNSLQKDWNYDLPCFPSAQVLFTATSMNWSWPVEISFNIMSSQVNTFLLLLWPHTTKAGFQVGRSMVFKKVAKLRK